MSIDFQLLNPIESWRLKNSKVGKYAFRVFLLILKYIFSPGLCYSTIKHSTEERAANLQARVKDYFNSTWNGCSSAMQGTGKFLAYHANRALHSDAEAAASLCILGRACYRCGKLYRQKKKQPSYKSPARQRHDFD